MKEIGAVTIGKLIEAHYEKNENKFKAYAEFIAEAYKERGEERAERIIRSKIDGTYKNKPVVVTLDEPNDEIKIAELEEQNINLQIMLQAEREVRCEEEYLKRVTELEHKVEQAKEIIVDLLQLIPPAIRRLPTKTKVNAEQFLNSEVKNDCR